MKIDRHIIDCVNTLGYFCGMRDLSWEDLARTEIDTMVLFGGSILAGGDLMAEAMRRNTAKTYIVVGGEGHTTQTLRDVVHARFPDIDTDGQPEAVVFSKYIEKQCGRRPDYLECRSTNCGNNLTYLLDLIRDNAIPCRRLLLCQDATMMRRMDAGLRLWQLVGITHYNYATYRAHWTLKDGMPVCDSAINGMWEWERYVNLLMGEIPRLTDDANGYGPNGKGFIAHCEIPQPVREAYEYLRRFYAVRQADYAYA